MRYARLHYSSQIHIHYYYITNDGYDIDDDVDDIDDDIDDIELNLPEHFLFGWMSSNQKC